jgi:hypothetical protein
MLLWWSLVLPCSVLMLATYSHQAKPGLPHRGLLRVRFDAPSE